MKPTCMRKTKNCIVTLFQVSLLGLIFTSVAAAQAYKVEAAAPEFDDLESPQFSGGSQKNFKPKNWLEIEASFKAQMAPEPPSKTAERMLIKWYVAVAHPDKRGAFLLLTKDVTHANVPLGEDVYSSIYLSPASIRRLTGSDRGGKGAVELVGYEILINGEKVASQTNKGKDGWWNLPSDKISRSDSVPLLDKNETPFVNMWWDRYAEILREPR